MWQMVVVRTFKVCGFYRLQQVKDEIQR